MFKIKFMRSLSRFDYTRKYVYQIVSDEPEDKVLEFIAQEAKSRVSDVWTLEQYRAAPGTMQNYLHTYYTVRKLAHNKWEMALIYPYDD